MSEKKSLSINAVRFVYGDETIVVQCALRQVVKGRILIKVHPDCRVVASVPSGTPEQMCIRDRRWSGPLRLKGVSAARSAVVRAGKATIKHLNLVFIMGVILLYLMRFATTEPQRALYHE